MHFYEYKGYTIYPTPHLVLESGYWRMEVIIRHKEQITRHSCDTLFSTRGEAVFHSISYGKKLIDEAQ